MSVFASFFDYGFLKTALLAVLLIMPLFSLLGTMVVNRGMAFSRMRSVTPRSPAWASACCAG